MRLTHALLLLAAVAAASAQVETEVPIVDTGVGAEEPIANTNVGTEEPKIEINEEAQEDQTDTSMEGEPAGEQGNPSEAIENLQKQMDFFGDFACFLSVQRHLMGYEDEFKRIGGNVNAQTVLKKVVANLFSICKANMTPEQQMSMITAKSKEDIEKIKFDQFDEVDMQSYLNDPEPQITETEKLNIDAYEKIEAEVSKMKEKYIKEQKEQGKEFVDPDTPKKEMSVMGFNLDKVNSLIFVLPIMLIIIAPLYYFWSKLFGSDASSAGKNKGKKKQKKSQDKKTQ